MYSRASPCNSGWAPGLAVCAADGFPAPAPELRKSKMMPRGLWPNPRFGPVAAAVMLEETAAAALFCGDEACSEACWWKLWLAEADATGACADPSGSPAEGSAPTLVEGDEGAAKPTCLEGPLLLKFEAEEGGALMAGFMFGPHTEPDLALLGDVARIGWD